MTKNGMLSTCEFFGNSRRRDYDSNKTEQLEILNDIQKIVEKCVAVERKVHFDFKAMIKMIGKGRIRDLTEFGRVVHFPFSIFCGSVDVEHFLVEASFAGSDVANAFQ